MEDYSKLHEMGQKKGPKTQGDFVNPGTPTSPLVSKGSRKSGAVPGANQGSLKEHSKGNSGTQY